jgi:acetolactate synthase I/III small subunit
MTDLQQWAPAGHFDTVTLSYTERFGAADRIMSLLRRRGFPISGMTLERTHQPNVGRMTVSVSNPAAVEQVYRHLRKLPDVLSVNASTQQDAVCREYALVRVHCVSENQPGLLELLEVFEARVLNTTEAGVVAEMSGTHQEIDTLFGFLDHYGIEEAARTNTMAISF